MYYVSLAMIGSRLAAGAVANLSSSTVAAPAIIDRLLYVLRDTHGAVVLQRIDSLSPDRTVLC